MKNYLNHSTFQPFNTKSDCRSDLLIQQKVAFTLAEVLITLGVIGVVAAITMPILIKNYQKTVWVNQLKKEYSVVSQVVQRIIADDGVDNWYDSKFINYIDQHDYDKLKLLAKEYYKANKICITNESSCLADGLEEYKHLNGTIANFGPLPITDLHERTDLLVFLSDGSVIIHSYYLILIDVNGLKSPNTYGKDVFLFNINGTKCEPLLDPDGECSKSATGWNCAARIIENGWKMDY